MQIRMFGTIASIVVTTGCIGSSFPQTPGKGGPPWQRMTTEHFVVDTDLDPGDADVVVGELENLRKAMVETVFGGEQPAGPRARVLALRLNEYRHFDRKYAGLFVSSAPSRPIFVMGPGADWSTFATDVRKHELAYYVSRIYADGIMQARPVLVTSTGGDWNNFAAAMRKHELAHYVSGLYPDGIMQPRWFREGLAVYLETILYDEKTGAVEVGRRPPGYEYLQYATHATSDELWSWGEEQPPDALAQRLYHTSWALVHYLFHERAPDLAQYRQALLRGEDARSSWNRIFPHLDGDGLGDIVRNHIRKLRHELVRATVPPEKAPVSIRTLGEADVLAWRAVLYLALRGDSQRSEEDSKSLARMNIALALEKHESNFLAHQVNLFFFGKVPDSIALAKETIAGQMDNWLAWIWYAEVLRRTKQPLSGRREALQKALELAPGNRMAITQLAWVEAESENWPTALELATRAVHLSPAATDSMLAYAVALSRSGRCREARTVEEQVTKRLNAGAPKEVTRIFSENREACGSP